MSSGIHFPIYYRRLNRYYFIKFLLRYHSSWHLLCGCPLPLRAKNGSCICYLCRIYTLISPINWTDPPQPMSQCTILPNIPRSKYHFLSSALFRLKWNTTTIFGLPRCIYKMKCSFIIWVSSILCGADTFHLHSMRSICFSTKSNCKTSHTFSPRMIRFHPPSRFTQS